MLVKLQKILEYHFNDIALLKEALSHPSLHGDHKFLGKDYERLEFLGDAVVNVIVTDILYHKFKSYTEGDLAKMRSYFISKEFMVKVAHDIELFNYMIVGSSEESAGGRRNPNNLENVLEAIIGAIYLDGGLKNAYSMVLKFWKKFITPDVLVSQDPKTHLQEMIQELGRPIPKYNVVEKSGPSHSPEFTVECVVESMEVSNGHGKSIKAAEKEAAIKMIEYIKKNNINA